jgi:DNA topoisomerase-1
MAPALYLQTSAELEVEGFAFKASGSTLKFPGCLKAYRAGIDEDDKNLLPELVEGELLAPKALEPLQHFTQAPPRFNDATLVKELEANGIGRPSTYASIVSVLRDKEYVEGNKGQLRPTEMGFVVNDLLVRNFPKILEVEFTAELEDNLDQIEEGQVPHLSVLRKLYEPLAANLETANELMTNVKREGIPAVGIPCPTCGADALKVRYGKNGFYLACDECKATCDFTRDDKGVPVPAPPLRLKDEVRCELCGRPMVLKKSRFGPFLACPGYPECRNTKPLKVDNGEVTTESHVPPEIPPGVLEAPCPKCGKPMVLKRSHKGSWFMSCREYPKCDGTRAIPSEFPCPVPGCDGTLTERHNKRGSFWGCGNYPDCTYIARGVPVKDPCPECGSSYRLEISSKTRSTYLSCPNQDCPSNEGKKKLSLTPARKLPPGKTAKKATTAKKSTSATAKKTTAATPKKTTVARKTTATPKKTTSATPGKTAAAKTTTSPTPKKTTSATARKTAAAKTAKPAPTEKPVGTPKTRNKED